MFQSSEPILEFLLSRLCVYRTFPDLCLPLSCRMVVLWAKSDCVPKADGPGLPYTGHSEQKEHKWLLSLLGGVLNGLLGRHEQC